MAQNASGSIKYDFFVSKKLYTYVNSLLEHDKFQDVNLRSTVGAGLGYQFLDDCIKALSFELGVSYFNESHYIASDKSYASGRWSWNFSYQLLPNKIALFHFDEGYFGFDTIKNVYIKTEQGVRFTVIKNFFTTIQANVNYNNNPTPGFKKTDTTLLFGLGYHFDL
jgi:putative salt-induced outer membrane protein YdiY